MSVARLTSSASKEVIAEFNRRNRRFKEYRNIMKKDLIKRNHISAASLALAILIPLWWLRAVATEIVMGIFATKLEFSELLQMKGLKHHDPWGFALTLARQLHWTIPLENYWHFYL